MLKEKVVIYTRKHIKAGKFLQAHGNITPIRLYGMISTRKKRGLSISISTSLLSIQPFLPLNLLLIGRIPLICFITLYIQYLGPGLHTEISFFKNPFTI